MLIGLDFDNTIICYDELFHKVALGKGLIPAYLPVEKRTIRDYLRNKGREDKWTLIQGEVYGERILEAVPFKGVFDALKILQNNGAHLVLVSHKTRTPFMGKQLDLQQAARNWLAEQRVFDTQGLDWKINQVFFELTKEEKVQRICKLQCTHYVDDLPEILEMLPKNISRIQFQPKLEKNTESPWIIMRSWSELPYLIS